MPSLPRADTHDDPALQAALDALNSWSAPRAPLPAADARWQAVSELCAGALARPARPLRDPLLIPLA